MEAQAGQLHAEEQGEGGQDGGGQAAPGPLETESDEEAVELAVAPAPLGRLRLQAFYNLGHPEHAYDEVRQQYTMIGCTSREGDRFVAVLAEITAVPDAESRGRNQLRFERWLYLPVSAQRLAELERGELTIRGAFLAAEEGFVWEVAKEAGAVVAAGRLCQLERLTGELPDPAERLKRHADGQVTVALIEPRLKKHCAQAARNVGEFRNEFAAEPAMAVDNNYA